MDTIVCPTCSSPNGPDANFCSVCGNPLPVDDHPDTSRTETHPLVLVEADEPLLVVIRGSNAGSRFALGDEVTTIGRHPDSTVLLDDVTVSRRHAEVQRTGDTYVLRDVGSLNGTYVDGDRVDVHVLQEGDQLQVGKFRLVFAYGVHDAAE